MPIMWPISCRATDKASHPAKGKSLLVVGVESHQDVIRAAEKQIHVEVDGVRYAGRPRVNVRAIGHALIRCHTTGPSNCQFPHA